MYEQLEEPLAYRCPCYLGADAFSFYDDEEHSHLGGVGTLWEGGEMMERGYRALRDRNQQNYGPNENNPK